MTDRPVQALQKAVAALYFADSSDYKTALWDVVRALSPDMAKLLEQDEAKAFQESQKLQSIADLDGYMEVPEPRSYQPRWVCLEGMNRDELAAYDYGASSAEQAVKRILDGQDKGEGCANEPWEALRQRLITLVSEEQSLREVAQGSVTNVTKIPLEDGYLLKEPHFNGGPLVWNLYKLGTCIRPLDTFESNFVEAALKARNAESS